jgi:splicing suppressor protein 51
MDADGWPDLRYCVEKSEIIEHCGDSRFPMQLRMFAEHVIGSGSGRQDGTTMMQIMASIEAGGGKRVGYRRY